MYSLPEQLHGLYMPPGKESGGQKWSYCSFSFLFLSSLISQHYIFLPDCNKSVRILPCRKIHWSLCCYKSQQTSDKQDKDKQKSDIITPFGGVFSIMKQFDRSLSSVNDITSTSRITPMTIGTFHQRQQVYRSGKKVSDRCSYHTTDSL